MGHFKYPRTYHLPYSRGYTSDDKVLTSDDQFKNVEVVITEKMDGENTTIYNDFYHARSLDSLHRDYHSWLLNYMKGFQYTIPCGYRICGEYLYARHSIAYTNLPSYFLVFSVWDDDNICLSWDHTKQFCDERNLVTVPVLYRGIYNSDLIQDLANKVVLKGGEGIVVRKAAAFSYDCFSENIAKYVRENHVQTEVHWSNGPFVKNQLSL
ncbi:RNA ligase family protein [Enterocloster citroniae]